MKQDRADLEPPPPRSGDDNGHIWGHEVFLEGLGDLACVYCECAQTSKEAQVLCRNIGSEKRPA